MGQVGRRRQLEGLRSTSDDDDQAEQLRECISGLDGGERGGDQRFRTEDRSCADNTEEVCRQLMAKGPEPVAGAAAQVRAAGGGCRWGASKHYNTGKCFNKVHGRAELTLAQVLNKIGGEGT